VDVAGTDAAGATEELIENDNTTRRRVGEALLGRGLAASKGYGVTIEEARAYVKAGAAATGKVLRDADLDGVAAAGTWNGQPLPYVAL
jgi:hypothetical protein